MKYKNEETKQFINLQYSVVKSEIANANSKISMRIALFGFFSAFFLSISVYVIALLNKDPDNLFTFLLLLLFLILSLLVTSYSMYMLVILFRGSKSVLSLENEVVNDNIEKLDVMFFATYNNVNEQTFIELFEYENEIEELTLKQIYKNGILANKKYSLANRLM